MDLTTSTSEDTDCRAVGDILSRVGDRWTVLVVVALCDRPCRFSALRRKVGGISQQMLTSTLRTLERDGMVERTVRATTPPQVSYALTDLGRSLSDTVRQLAEWSITNLATIHDNRKRYDQQRASL
ncbi:transcriptional regulator, HxlR family [Methylorubrum populi BJ001]|jgi:DNA-binding HxlR family transcriptional regulator|uniref:Transcriptional regulator, HxlR family n=1 Tax=Methylorubrum populi (strain ATCC BAA-705 / NCIMB 13946 / BJ001) TaxID=441620 RepID=B1Z9I2_METPB|nr:MULTISPECIES: helix-turn-helix domain-containing protein [Methylorubrum]ACB81946.1 transcriptional regulator, HxlR family [Methylorubrum populi BJ001]MBB5765306.1 DNA-binding HxlR family transcriptional regulator [Methylorubrum rhodesianum]